MTMKENLNDFMKLIEKAKVICESQPYCNEECLFCDSGIDADICIFENPPIDW